MIPDTIKPTRDSLTAVLTVLMAVLMMTTPALAASASGGGGAAVQPLAFGVDLGSPDVPADAIRYGAEGNPGIMVTLESSEDIPNIKQWANASEDRSVLETYNGTNTVLLSTPADDIRPPLTSIYSWLPGGESTISSLGYVEGYAWDVQVGYADPMNSLDTSDTFQKPAGAFYASAVSSGDYSADMMAWESDATNSNLTHVSGLVGADEVSVTGEGVNVAVIDSGVNIGNGTLYGNGTSGSDMRVVDAHDYVEGQSVDLTANRSEIPEELAKVADPNGHGSWVSSAVLNAQTGIAPDANLMAYRALNSEGQGSTSDIRAAIERADAEGADIIVMSLGSPMYSDGMADALKYALSEDGNVSGAFVAVGNSYTTTRYVSSPADVEKVIGVTATNAANASEARKAYFANVGPDTGLDGSNGGTHGVKPDTAAPGMAINAPTFTAPGTEGGRVTDTRLSGTSMAAPIAAGVGALLLDAEPGLKGEPTEFRDRLVNSGSHTPHLGTTHSLGGMVNATRAIQGYDGPDAPDRELPDKTEGWDDANKALSGDVGVKMSQISQWMNLAL